MEKGFNNATVLVNPPNDSVICLQASESSGLQTRLVLAFQSLEKIIIILESSNYISPDDHCQLRTVTSRILQYLTLKIADLKSNRDFLWKSESHLDRLLFVLEHSRDKGTLSNVIEILILFVRVSSTCKKSLLSTRRGVIHTLLQVLVCESKESDRSDTLLISIHRLLSKLGAKDRRLAIRARLLQALDVSVTLLQSYLNNPKLLQPVIQVLKLYAADVVNADHLGKNGVVINLLEISLVLRKKDQTLLKTILDTLAFLLKSKTNVGRLITVGGVPSLLQLYVNWQRLDNKNKHLKVRKAILSVLNNIVNSKPGCVALMEADGVHLLFDTCLAIIDCKEAETVLYIASLIMRKCFPKNRLPIPTLKNPLECPQPVSDIYRTSSDDAPGEEVGYDSSLDNDGEISSDDDRDNRKVDSDGEPESGFVFMPEDRRTSEDLEMYRDFFSELYDMDALMRELDPTYNMVNLASGARHSKSQSSSEILKCCSQLLDSQVVQNHTSETEFSRKTKRLSTLIASNDLAAAPNDFQPEISPKSSKKLGQGRSPKTRPKGSKITKSVTNKKTKAKVQPKAEPSVEDWLSFDLSSAMKMLTSSGDLLVDPRLEDDVPSDEDESTSRDDMFNNQKIDDPDLYAEISKATRSVGRFDKLAHPDMHGHCTPPFKEPFYEKKFDTQRQKIFEDIDRFINPEQILDQVVYDMDSIIYLAGPTYKEYFSSLVNDDESRASTKVGFPSHLRFNSQFESGNLRKVLHIRRYEYDLILMPDINGSRHHQWFYFEVSNMEANVPYRFNIINCEKPNSQFNFGMRPVMYSVTEAQQGRPWWIRTGNKICYYKNHFVRSAQTTGGVRGKTYYTATFTITFQHEGDVCYIAYHYPYTYTTLQYHLQKSESTYNSSSIYFKRQSLCETVWGNEVPILTITSHPLSYDHEGIAQMKNRPYIFLTSRVHPGESNASWVMKGTIDFLLSESRCAKQLRDSYIFKIVPMLNPDGVINGNHRCSLVAEDLNRRWLCPCPKRHPTIYHTKGLLQYLQDIGRPPFVFCDYHGHSRRKNVFLYGCSPSQSWLSEDLDNPAIIIPDRLEDLSYKILPKILHHIAPAFSFNGCNFSIDKTKETTARVVVWRRMRVLRSYTMESTYCGCDQGPYRGCHISTHQLEEMGQQFCRALIKLNGQQHLRVPFTDATTSTISTTDLQSSSATVAMEETRRPGDSNSSIGSTSSEPDDIEQYLDNDPDDPE